jgi:hypothetical protein
MIRQVFFRHDGSAKTFALPLHFLDRMDGRRWWYGAWRPLYQTCRTHALPGAGPCAAARHEPGAERICSRCRSGCHPVRRADISKAISSNSTKFHPADRSGGMTLARRCVSLKCSRNSAPERPGIFLHSSKWKGAIMLYRRSCLLAAMCGGFLFWAAAQPARAQSQSQQNDKSSQNAQSENQELCSRTGK